MATSCSPDGITIIEVDADGKILSTTAGYGQGWRIKATDNDRGSPEWLSELVLKPDQKSLQDVVQEIEAARAKALQAKEAGATDGAEEAGAAEVGTKEETVFKGDPAPGTSGTTCDGAVFRLARDDKAPSPTPEDYKYFVLAQGVWIDKTTGRNVPRKTPNSEYRASSFIVSEHAIDQISSLKRQWEALKNDEAAISDPPKDKSS